MKRVLLLLLAAMTMSFSTSGFCDGWEDGYQQALEDCLRVGVSPACPVEPANSDGYKTGFGRGYAKASAKYCN